MASFHSGALVDLDTRDSLVLADIRGVTIRVNRGTLWITQENDTQDIVLRAGDTWRVERAGQTIVEAQSAATLWASGPGIERALGQALRDPSRWHAATGKWTRPVARRLAAMLRAWSSLTPRRSLPYV